MTELRKTAGRASMNVRVSAERQRNSDLLISVITLMEIEIGVARLERRDSVRGDVVRKSLERALLAAFAIRVLPVDLGDRAQPQSRRRYPQHR